MKFNDYKIVNEKESELLKTHYQKILSEEISDLNEILEKMYKQRDILTTTSHPKILEKLNADIHKLEDIVHNFNYHKTPQNTYTLSIPNEYRKVTKLDDSRLSPYRSTVENSRSTLKTTNKRHCPKQSPSIFNILNRFKVKKETLPRENRLRFHTIVDDSTYNNIIYNNININDDHRTRHDCPPEKEVMHNQIDIVRLLLLYMLLRPTCKHMSIIASITSSEFDNYVELSSL